MGGGSLLREEMGERRKRRGGKVTFLDFRFLHFVVDDVAELALVRVGELGDVDVVIGAGGGEVHLKGGGLEGRGGLERRGGSGVGRRGFSWNRYVFDAMREYRLRFFFSVC